jgi:hypothetical protein
MLDGDRAADSGGGAQVFRILLAGAVAAAAIEFLLELARRPLRVRLLPLAVALFAGAFLARAWP